MISSPVFAFSSAMIRGYFQVITRAPYKLWVKYELCHDLCELVSEGQRW